MTEQVSASERSRIGAAPRREESGRGRRLGRTGVVAAAATAALIAGSVAAGATPVASVGKTGADGHVASASPHRIGTAPHLPKGAVRIGATSASTSVQLSVGLVPRNPQELKDFIAATTTKGNAQYHHYLAKGQFASVFGPTPATIAKVTASLKAEGLKPGKVSSDGLSIPVTTTVATAGHAFGTHFTSYKLPGGVTGFANSAAPLVSGSIAADVSGITGLNTVARHQTMHTVVPPTSSTSAATTGTPASGSSAVVQHSAVTPVPSGPQLCGSAVTALGKTYKGSSDGKGYISAGSLAATYGMSHTSTSGAGITVGVFEMENFSTKDLAAYQSCYGTKVSVTRRTVDGGPKEAVNPAKIGGKTTGNGIESLLDLEDIASLAPGAKIIDYQGVDLDKATNTNWLHTFQAMVTDDAASVLSMSYGGCEDDSDYSVIVAENYYSAEAAAQGQTILASSGDDGATDCYEDSGSPNTLAASVDDPASQPYVTGVGGTTLTSGGTDKAAATSTAWADSGGGTSVVWSLPSGNDYQSGFEADGYDGDSCDAASGYNCRQVPDVAANANPKSGYPVYYGAAWHLVGGTSGASPTWAALLAIANTQSACRSNGPLGMINFALYQVARDNYAANFRDVTTGTNKAVQGLGYNATTGYDLPTGLGEPKAAALSAALCATVPAPAKGPSTFHTVAPTRLLDTRTSSSTPLPAGGVSGVQIEGNPAVPGIPTSGVTAVVLDMSVTKTSGTGVLTAWGDGTPRPKTSNLNWTKGQTVSNLVTVAVPGDGWVDFYNNSPTQVIADIQGYYTDDTSGQTYTSLPKGSQRLLDTRTKNKKPLSNTTLSLPITSGTDPLAIPADATAVVLNLTAVSTVNSGHLTAWAEKPGSTPPSSVYNVSWTGSGVTQAGLSVVPIGADGNVSVQIAGTSQVIADVFGYYTPDSTGKVFNTTKPTRILDTRSAIGVSTKTLIPSGHVIKLQVTGGSLPVPAGAAAVVLNVTAADVTKAGVLSVWADGASTPTATNLNWWAKNQAVPNQVIVPIGADGKIDLKVSSSSAAVIADVFGYFN
jgi:hypothetical protein